MTIGNTIALTRRTFVGKLMSLLFKPPMVGIKTKQQDLVTTVWPVSSGCPQRISSSEYSSLPPQPPVTYTLLGCRVLTS